MRIEIIGTRGYPSYYGGFETAVRKLAPFLCDRGHVVTVYGRRRGDVSAGGDRRVVTRITWGVDHPSLSTLTHGLTACLNAIRHKPDAVLIMNVANGFYLPMLRIRGIPTVVNVDGIEWERGKWSWTGKLVFRLGARLCARYANEIVCDAEAINDYWARKFSRRGIYIPYGGEPTEEDLPTPFGLPPQGYVLMVARLVPENSVGLFLDAADALSQRWPVVIVGSAPVDDPLRRDVENLVRRRRSVRWLGHLSDDTLLHALWRNCGAYFHGHTVGGTNPALVQAMHLAAPIVARDTVYNREVLGEAGVYVADDVEGIVRALSSLMDESSRRTTSADMARTRARMKFRWDDVCAKYETTLSAVAAGHSSWPAGPSQS